MRNQEAQFVGSMRRKIERPHETASYSSGTWTPTFTGFSADPAGGVYRYVLIGKLCTAFVYMPNNGTSDATSFTMTGPFTSANLAGTSWFSSSFYVDNSAGGSGGVVYISGNSSTITLLKIAAANWTASGGKRASFTLAYEVA